MQFHVITLFPEMIEQACSYGVLSRAIEQKIVSVRCWNPRDYAHDRHRTVDDRPYGGGPGMLMKVQPLADAIVAAKEQTDKDHVDQGSHSHRVKVIYLSPQGKRLNQQAVRLMAGQDKAGSSSVEPASYILVAGRYEGIDERLIKQYIDEEWSIGDYVLSGGETPAMVLIDAVARMLPGVLGDEMSAQQDSFMEGLLDCPHYTRPEEIDGLAVPEVLLSGDHAAIARWRQKQALGMTWLRRPDLLEAIQLDDEQKQLLAEFQLEHR
jgi:tRNA (guanine37-N1)-methyltransferase